MVSPEKSDNENVPPEARGIVKAVKNKNVGCKEKEHIKKLRPLQSKVSLNDGEIFLMQDFQNWLSTGHKQEGRALLRVKTENWLLVAKEIN